MQIVFHGYSCFTIKGDSIEIVTDPFTDELGVVVPQLTADLVTVSHDHRNHCNTGIVSGSPKIFDWPGEYEYKDVSLKGVSTFHNKKDQDDRGENISFVIVVDDIKICHLGSLGSKLTDKQLELLGDIDILMMPIGGETTIDPKKGVDVIEQIDPRIIIPMRYKLPGLTRELESVENFAKLLGHEVFETSQKLVTSKLKLPTDTAEFVVLEPV